jgi:hypothetical protein
MWAGRRPEEMMADDTPLSQTPSKDELRGALKAFKKRLKLTQLDADSQLSRRPTTSGRKADIVAIAPPDSHPQAVWEELVKQGKLKHAGHGLYELVEEGMP